MWETNFPYFNVEAEATRVRLSDEYYNYIAPFARRVKQRSCEWRTLLEYKNCGYYYRECFSQTC